MCVWRETVRRARGLYLVLLLLSLLNLSVAIYEDQIGKFDWRQTYVGRIKFARLDTVSAARRIIVATEENVLAALNLKTGQVVWRHVLESAGAGEMQLLHVSDAAITVSGDNPYLVRGWDTATGLMLWEWALTLNTEAPELSQWFVQQGQLYHVLPVPGSRLEVSSYSVRTGQNRGKTQRLSAPWVNQGCVLHAPRYTCISGEYGSQYVFTVEVSSSDLHVTSKPLSTYVDWSKTTGTMRQLDGNSAVPGFVVDDRILVTEDNNLKVLDTKLQDSSASVTIVDSSEGALVLQTWYKDGGVDLSAHRLSDGTPIAELTSRSEAAVPGPTLAAALCTRAARDPHACRFLVTGADHSATLLQRQGNVLWSREEALASIAAVEFVDLPVSELEAAIETEFTHKEGDVWGALTRRLHSQAQQLAAWLRAAARAARGARDDEPRARAPLVRDDFDLHKVIVAATSTGKIFGIDNLSGEVLWSRYVPQLSTERGVSIFARRSARHPPHDAHATIVASHKETGNGLLVSVNPITGELVAEGVLALDYRLKQAALLPRADAEHLRALVLLDAEDSVQVLPVSASSLVEDFYLYVAERETTHVQGFALKYNGRTVIAQRTWSLAVGGSGHRIVRAVPKSPLERVHSHGKVMGDRSVLYKYINPNLVLFITEGPDPVHKDVVHMVLVDVVSGSVVAAQSHRRARATAHAVHADNLLAYAYHNDKHRRTEIATVELYEGASRSLPAGAAFSSLSAQPVSPLVERQTYILPATLAAMADTITERGIADKHILLSLSTGVILEIPWAYLEPRRPVGALTQEHREEGLLQYAPELPLPSEAAVNYNRTLSGTRALHTAPSGLESTCLVLAYGLDLFYTRVAPSKTFDLLKDDFDYYLITLVLGALIFATYSTKFFASRKMLRQAWK